MSWTRPTLEGLVALFVDEGVGLDPPASCLWQGREFDVLDKANAARA